MERRAWSLLRVIRWGTDRRDKLGEVVSRIGAVRLVAVSRGSIGG